MTKAIVTQAFVGRPDDEIVARTIALGETLTGDLADVALREKWAEPAGKATKREQVQATKAAQQAVTAATAEVTAAEAALAAADEAGKAAAQDAVDAAKAKLGEAEAALAALA